MGCVVFPRSNQREVWGGPVLLNENAFSLAYSHQLLQIIFRENWIAFGQGVSCTLAYLLTSSFCGGVIRGKDCGQLAVPEREKECR